MHDGQFLFRGQLVRAIRGISVCTAVFVALAAVGIGPLQWDRSYGDTVTVVPYYEHLEAPGYYYFDPVTGVDIERDQIIMDGSLFTGFGGPVVIDSLAFRLDKDASATSASFDDIQVRLSTALTTVATLSTTLANNIGPDETTVFSGPLTLTSSAGAGNPSDFDLLIPFLVPFQYDPTAGDLLLDWQYTANFGGSSFRIDFNHHNANPFRNIVTYAEDSRPAPNGIAEDMLRGGSPIMQFSVSPAVPEPATLLLALLGLACLSRGFRSRLRR